MGKNQGSVRARAARACRAVGLIVVLGSFAVAARVAADPASRGLEGECEIHFVGSSTLHDFSGQVHSHPFALAYRIDESGAPGSWSGSIEVPVAEMDTGIERRNRKMFEMFDADSFPLIVADFPRLGGDALARARSDDEIDLDFDLTIREVTRPVAAKLSNWTETERSASFDAEFELSLAEFGLEPPAVLGLIRVGDAVVVRAHVVVDGLPADARGGATVGAPPRSPALGS